MKLHVWRKRNQRRATSASRFLFASFTAFATTYEPSNMAYLDNRMAACEICRFMHDELSWPAAPCNQRCQWRQYETWWKRNVSRRRLFMYMYVSTCPIEAETWRAVFREINLCYNEQSINYITKMKATHFGIDSHGVMAQGPMTMYIVSRNSEGSRYGGGARRSNVMHRPNIIFELYER